MSKLKIAVIIASTRPNRFGDRPARWVLDLARESGFFEVELVDLVDFPLPNFDAPASDLWMPSPNADAVAWQLKLSSFDGFIIVTPEYNRSIPAALKNALDWASKPFIRKPVAFVGYGSVGGAFAIAHLRSVMVEAQAVPVRQSVYLGGSDFFPVLMGQTPWDDVAPKFIPFANELLKNLAWWGRVTKAGRDADAAQAA